MFYQQYTYLLPLIDSLSLIDPKNNLNLRLDIKQKKNEKKSEYNKIKFVIIFIII